MNLDVVDGKAGTREAGESIRDILASNQLCALATVDTGSGGSTDAHAATAFYVYDDDLNFYILTPPETDHCRNLGDNGSISLAIYDSTQEWGDDKKGLQVFGSAEQVEESVETALELYIERFPGLEEFASTPEELAELDSEFYRVTPERIKIFDEPRFGEEEWVTVEVIQRG